MFSLRAYEFRQIEDYYYTHSPLPRELCSKIMEYITFEGKLDKSYDGHLHYVNSIIPIKGNKIVSCDYDGRIIHRDLSNPRGKYTISTNRNKSKLIKNGEHFISGSNLFIHKLDIHTGEIARVWMLDFLSDLTPHDENTFIVSQLHLPVALFDVRHNDSTHALGTLIGRKVLSVNDNTIAATHLNDYGIHFMDLRNTRESLYELNEPENAVSCLKMEGNIMWTGDEDAVIRAFDTDKKEYVAEIKEGHTDYITGLERVDDTLVTTSADGFIKVWDVRNCGEAKEVHSWNNEMFINALNITENKKIVFGDYGNIKTLK